MRRGRVVSPGGGGRELVDAGATATPAVGSGQPREEVNNITGAKALRPWGVLSRDCVVQCAGPISLCQEGGRAVGAGRGPNPCVRLHAPSPRVWTIRRQTRSPRGSLKNTKRSMVRIAHRCRHVGCSGVRQPPPQPRGCFHQPMLFPTSIHAITTTTTTTRRGPVVRGPHPAGC